MTVRTHNAYGYKNGCRCDACRSAFNTYMRDYQHRRRRAAGAPTRGELIAARRPDHGTESRYAGGCRCNECREASRTARARRRAAKGA